MREEQLCHVVFGVLLEQVSKHHVFELVLQATHVVIYVTCVL